MTHIRNELRRPKGTARGTAAGRSGPRECFCDPERLDRQKVEHQPTDDELMARGAAGDEGAFRLLVERSQGPVFAFLERMLGSAEEAQDLGQETFLRLVQQAARYRPEGRFQSWLFRIAGNLARSRLRRRKILRWIPFEVASHDQPATAPPPDHALEAEESGRRVRTALEQLPERQREALVLRHYQEMSYREIADAMNTSVPAVEALRHRALTALRQDLPRRTDSA